MFTVPKIEKCATDAQYVSAALMTLVSYRKTQIQAESLLDEIDLVILAGARSEYHRFGRDVLFAAHARHHSLWDKIQRHPDYLSIINLEGVWTV